MVSRRLNEDLRKMESEVQEDGVNGKDKLSQGVWMYASRVREMESLGQED